jgi:hypothetical protein
MRNTWKDTGFMDDMASLDCVIFNSYGLDRHESQSSTKRMEVIAKKGSNKGQAFGVSCFSFLYNGVDAIPEHSGDLIKKVCGVVKKHHCHAILEKP